MKIDTSSYYPKSPLDDEEGEKEPQTVRDSIFPLSEKEETKVGEKREETEGLPEKTDIKDELSGEKFPDEKDLPRTEGEELADNLSTAVSWILVPLLMPVYGALLAFNFSILDYSPSSTKWLFTLIIAGINVLVPAALFMLLKRVGIVEDLGLNGRKERLLPYIITIVAMGITAFFLWRKHAPLWFAMFYLGGAAAGLINMLVNFRWKISAHAAAIAGIVALLIRILHQTTVMPGAFTWLIIFIVLSGMMGAARIWLGRHTVAQVMAGYAVGFLSVFLMTMIG